MSGLPLPNLLDCMGAEDGPSCSEEEKDAGRQRSAFTTPTRSTISIHPTTTIGLWELPQWVPKTW